MSCPPFSDLSAPNAATALHAHLLSCARCRAIVARIKQAGVPLAPDSYSGRPAALAGPGPQPGGVWAFWTPTTDEYVVAAVLHSAATELLILPLLMDTTWANDEDIVLPADVLGYTAMVPVWAGDHVLTEQAAEPVDALSERFTDMLRTAYDALVSGHALPQGGGPPVLAEQDPRVAAHAAIADDLRPLYAPWAMLQVADELGPVIAHRRADLGVSVDELHVEPKSWVEFEAGKADPSTHISANAMTRVLQRLGFVASLRIVELAHASVSAHHRSDSGTGTRAMARRRRGVIPPARRDPEAARVAADRYADALAEELGL
jgi:hypothetical protein